MLKKCNKVFQYYFFLVKLVKSKLFQATSLYLRDFFLIKVFSLRDSISSNYNRRYSMYLISKSFSWSLFGCKWQINERDPKGLLSKVQFCFFEPDRKENIKNRFPINNKRFNQKKGKNQSSMLTFLICKWFRDQMTSKV